MTRFKRILAAIAASISLGFALQASAQNTSITVHVNDAGQAAGGVSIFVLAGGNKFSPATPPAGTTDSSGAFAIPPGLLSANKPHSQVEVYEYVCQNGEKKLFIVPKGAESQLPEDTHDCKKRRVGAFWWDGGSSVAVNIAQDGGVTQSGGSSAATAMGKSAQFELGAYGGAGIIAESPYSSPSPKFLFDGAVLFHGGPFSFGPVFGGEFLRSSVLGGYGSSSYYTTSYERKTATSPTYNGPSLGMKNVRIGGRFDAPFGPFRFNVDAGALVSRLSTTAYETDCTGSLCTTSYGDVYDTHAGIFAGAQFSRNVCLHSALTAGWTYDRVNDGDFADVHVNEFYAGVRYRFNAPF